MKTQKEGYRVAVVGASSLLGKELVNVLEEQGFPVSRLVTFEADEEEPDLPIVDLHDASQAAVQDQEVSEAELDFAFLAARLHSIPSFLRTAERLRAGGAEAPRAHCFVIDLTGEGVGEQRAESLKDVVCVPFLDRRFPAADMGPGGSPFYVSPHPAVIVISSLLLRLAARFPLRNAVAQLFGSASEIGSRGIEELQKQTVSLLSFQKIPRQVFGAQLAFNLLSRLGRSGSGDLTSLETLVRQQLRQYLGQRVPLPALRLFQVPIFYALGVSLYVETAEPVAPEAAAAALVGERIRVRRSSQDAPSPVEVTGSSHILVDDITRDPEHPTGIWLWAVADNLRLAAVNAGEIAESLRKRGGP